MKRRHTNNQDKLTKQETGYLNESRKIVFVKADKRPWREMKPNEHWALDVEQVEGARYAEEEYIGHWRVTTDPDDIGCRPHFDVPVQYCYFIHQQRPPGEKEWQYDPEKAAQF